MSPESKRRARAVLTIGGALVGVIVLGAIVVAVINSSRTPEAAAERYVQLIADGDAEAANLLVPPDVPDSERGLLSNDVLAVATRIDDVRTRPAVSLGGDDTHEVGVEFGLGGRQEEASLIVVPDGKDFWVFDRWRVVTPLTGYLMVVSPGPASVAGVDLLVVAPDSDYTVPGSVAYPGIYPVQPGELEYYDPPPAQDAVVTATDSYYDDSFYGDSGEDAVQFDYTPNDQLVDAVNNAVGDWLQQCLDTGEDPDYSNTYSSNCMYGGDSVPGYYSPDDAPDWEIQTPPSMSMSPEDPNGTMFTGDATVAVSFDYSGFGGQETVESTIDVTISAVVQPSPDGVDIQVYDTTWTPTS